MVIEVVCWACGVWLLGRLGRVGAADPDGQDPGVAVVIPARDEAATLPILLASLARQQPAAAEIVVVDDHSSDGTAAVAARWAPAGVRVLAPPDVPEGWAGKPWACHHGAAATDAPVLVFLDADVELGPAALGRLAGEQRRRGGLVSVAPHHVTERPYEQLSALCNVVSMMGTDAFTLAGTHLRPRGAFGACLAVGRADYERVGGHAHADVRDRVLEDLAFARVFPAAGLPVSCAVGAEVVRYRMYPGGVRQLVEGWTKGLAVGVGRVRVLTLALVVAWLSGATAAAADAGLALVGRGRVGPAAAAVAYGAFAAQVAWMLGRIGRFRLGAAVLYPVPLVAFYALFLRSLVHVVLLRRVRWRGRRVAVPGR